MSHPLKCRCGTIQGYVEPSSVNHAMCYCNDCQAFAHFLGRDRDVLDPRGGSEVIQVLPKNVTFTQGVQALACLRLTDKGLLRWYASCCNTPIGNTLGNYKLSFVGLVHVCLDTPGTPLEVPFGPIRTWVFTKTAKGEPKPAGGGIGRTIVWFAANVLRARIDGDYRRTPFFDSVTGRPIVVPKVLTSAEHATVMAAVRGSSPT